MYLVYSLKRFKLMEEIFPIIILWYLLFNRNKYIKIFIIFVYGVSW